VDPGVEHQASHTRAHLKLHGHEGCQPEAAAAAAAAAAGQLEPSGGRHPDRGQSEAGATLIFCAAVSAIRLPAAAAMDL
jgi:hypothetical protein